MNKHFTFIGESTFRKIILILTEFILLSYMCISHGTFKKCSFIQLTRVMRIIVLITGVLFNKSNGCSGCAFFSKTFVKFYLLNHRHHQPIAMHCLMKASYKISQKKNIADQYKSTENFLN